MYLIKNNISYNFNIILLILFYYSFYRCYRFLQENTIKLRDSNIDKKYIRISYSQ